MCSNFKGKSAFIFQVSIFSTLIGIIRVDREKDSIKITEYLGETIINF